MQGVVWDPTLCATTVDTIGKECLEDKKYLYKYRNKIEIPPLAMLDDLMCISQCGPESVQMGSYINYKISSKKTTMWNRKVQKNAHRKHT